MCAVHALRMQSDSRSWHAVYGGFFIILSYAWGWAVDRERPDAGEKMCILNILHKILCQVGRTASASVA